jgi:hypothetical protein
MSGLAFDLSGFLALPSSVKLDYQQYWNTFNRIQAFNSNVSTIRSGGDKQLTYYSFANYDEVTSFTQGQYLHVQRYPNSNWPTVSKD